MEKAVITFETILVGSFNFKIFSYLPVYNLLLCDNNGLTVREQCAVWQRQKNLDAANNKS